MFNQIKQEYVYARYLCLIALRVIRFIMLTRMLILLIV